MVTYGFANERDKKFPQMIQLAINNVCNSECSYCPHSSFVLEKDYSPKQMSLELHEKICKEVSNYPNTSIRYLAWGEPMLHPDLDIMVRDAKKLGVSLTNLITNGTLLDVEKSKDLISAGLDVLEVSVNANSLETYELIGKRKDDFHRVVNNTLNFLNLRDTLHGNTYVSVSIIDQPYAKQEVGEFIDFWKDKADRVILRKYHDFLGHNKDIDIKSERHPCRVLWSRFNVNYDGLASICYNDWHNKNIIGDLKKNGETIEGLWNSKRYEEFRQSHLKGTPKGICADCNGWIGASWTLPYEVMLSDVKEKINSRKSKNE